MRTLVAAGVSALLISSATAADVTFSGTLSGVCSLALTTPGTLALSTDGTTLGSEELGGIPAAVAILSIGSYTVTVNAPTRTASPAAYSTSGEAIQVSYLGLGALSLVSQGYTASNTTFSIGSLPLSVLTMNNRIVNPNGFAAGTYTTRTVVTCS